MEKQSATRNTALTSAPRTSARAQPNVFLLQDLGAIRTENKTYKYKVCLNSQNVPKYLFNLNGLQ